MPRYKCIVEYDGTPYVGWQTQKNGLSVQEVMEAAFLSLSGEEIRLRGAGRTDTGVHALGQVVHADLSRAWRPDVLREALNAHMRPNPIAILSAEEVPDTFDARFSAIRRHYLYRIVNRRAPLTVDAGRAWHLKRKLNAEAMHEAAQLLLGEHDFSTFRDSQCQAASPVRTLERFDVSKYGEEIQFRLSARSFLHRQVRSMVGSLENVGSGKWKARDIKAALDARDRRRCGPVAPPEGLYLTQVDYGEAVLVDQDDDGE
jgi:tRNA pseudouridine38-40 synthase